MIYSKLLGAGVILAAAAMPNAAKAADAFAPAADRWTGPYVGVFGGYVSLDADGEYEGEGVIDGGPVKGFLYGGQIGYNKQIESAVLGIEADIALSDADGDVVNDSGTEFAATDLNYLATIRGRAGMLLGESESTLLFATAGLAVAEFDVDFEGEAGTFTHLGVVAGGGLEHMLTEQISVKAEYNYMVTFDKDTGGSSGEDIGYDGHVAKLGVNFHF